MNKKIRKILAAVLALSMIACLFASCDKTPANSDEPSTDNDSAAVVYNVGICQLVQHEALDAATQGFMDALKAKFGDNVKFSLQNAAGDSNTCSTIVNQFVSDDVDLIMANATPALQAAVAATDKIPIVATSVTDFATALEISDWTGKTGVNVTGTADLAPLADQAKIFTEILPEAKKIGILYCSSEANSKYQSDVISAEFDKLGLEYDVYTVADTNEIASVVTKACEEVDAIYIPTDNTIASATAAVNEIAAPANIPIIAGEEGICKGCGVASLSINYYSLGYNAGNMAAEILANGKNPADMEIQYATELTNKYVAERAEALGITIPDTYVAIPLTEE